MSTPPPSPHDPLGSAPQTPTERAQFWVARLVAGDVSETELDALDAWLAADAVHARAFETERALWRDLEAVSDALDGRAVPEVRRGLSRRRLGQAVPLALAASLLIAFMAPSLLVSINADHRTTAGEVRKVTLADGSTVMLDSRSAISVDFKASGREIRLLEGRAWFDVRHERRPFSVEAAGGVTQDIGTGFEVAMHDKAVDVAVTQGAARVQAPSGEESQTLRAGDSVRYVSAGLQRLVPREPGHLAAWRNGEILLEQRPVADALAEIARYRGAPLWTMGDFSKVAPVSGLFLTERPDEAMETIARMRGLRIMQLPGGILLVRPPA